MLIQCKSRLTIEGQGASPPFVEKSTVLSAADLAKLIQPGDSATPLGWMFTTAIPSTILCKSVRLESIEFRKPIYEFYKDVEGANEEKLSDVMTMYQSDAMKVYLSRAGHQRLF